MNVLFISISSMPHISKHSISLDLIHEFQRNGHDVYVVCAREKKENAETELCCEAGCKVLRVKIGNNKKASPHGNHRFSLRRRKQVRTPWGNQLGARRRAVLG